MNTDPRTAVPRLDLRAYIRWIKLLIRLHTQPRDPTPA